MSKLFIVFYIVYELLNPGNLCGQSMGFNINISIQDQEIRPRNIKFIDDILWLTGDIGIDSTGVSGIFILQSDTFGTISNFKIFRDPNLNDHLLLNGKDPVIMTQIGGIILAGVFFAKNDLYIVQLDQDFDTIWYKEFKSDYRRIDVHNIFEINSYYYVTGYIQSINFDLDVFIQKIDFNGEQIWAKTFGIPERNEFSRSAIPENGGLTIMISESFDPSPNLNNTRYWVRFMHIDTSGAIKWDWKEEVTGHEGWSGTLLKYDDDYIYTTNLLGEELNFGYFQAGQVVRRDSNFNVVWRQPYGEPDNYFNGLGDMIIARDSNLLITGQILDSTKKFMLERVIRISPMGELLCDVRDTGRILDNGESLNTMEGIAESETGSIYAVGYTYLGGGFYEGLLLKIGPDGCVDTLTTSTAIDEYIHLEETGFLAYPNPVTNNLTFKISDQLPRDAMISVYNLQGVEIRRVRVSGDSFNMNTDDWPEGVYLATLHKDGLILANTMIIKKQ